MPAINTNECKELAEYVLERILDDDTWNGYEEEEDVIELFRPKKSEDDFTLKVGNRSYVSPSYGVRIVTNDTFDKSQYEYEIIVRRVK